MLTCYNLSLEVDNEILFQNLSFTCFSGGILFIKGKNGSGKTSLLRMIAGIQNHTGEITFFKNKIEYLEKPYALYIGHKTGIRTDLTVIQNLSFWSKMYGSELMLEASVRYWDLYDVLEVECYKLSAGNQKKVALAKLLCCHSNLWLLDEIDSNLDSTNLHLLQNLLRTKMETGGIVIVTSHNSIGVENSHMNTLYMEDFSKTLL